MKLATPAEWAAWGRALGGGLVDLALPPRCADCGRGTAGAALCPRCDWQSAAPLPEAAPPAPVASWTAAVAHEGAAQEWVWRFKFTRPGLAGLDPHADAVARFWIRRAAAAARTLAGAAPELVLPVPLHRRRLRARGFNQSVALARDAARALAAPWSAQALLRIRDTQSQTGLSRSARQRNVAGAFRACGRLPRRVWLVDDVATTGATLAAAARALRRAGAREIRALTLAWRPLAR